MDPLVLKDCPEFRSKDREAYKEPKACLEHQVVMDKLGFQVSTVLQEDKATRANEALKDLLASGL
jgi:hypothetical protein